MRFWPCNHLKKFQRESLETDSHFCTSVEKHKNPIFLDSGPSFKNPAS